MNVMRKTPNFLVNSWRKSNNTHPQAYKLSPSALHHNYNNIVTPVESHMLISSAEKCLPHYYNNSFVIYVQIFIPSKLQFSRIQMKDCANLLCKFENSCLATSSNQLDWDIFLIQYSFCSIAASFTYYEGFPFSDISRFWCRSKVS